ncbi:ABC transporter substrate-binding protein [Halotalea alkalilenta]|uniref:ABC transporter substrate-binding protein n=1 Tax=Halotalea alkalilenta TaxID=376489 RepID=A0A172YBQ9_9GAMM|nr:ABC transporter substrate-binding protein [Halotalea alkalilenta]ANF56657.1 ABC transporter substrate-binding protein [Halotalea alkalilenta]
MKKLLSTLIVSSALATAIHAAAQDTTPQGTLRIAFADPVSAVDPELNNHAGNNSVAIQIFDTLTSKNWDNRAKPALAENFRNIDPNTWEFTLRNDVQWHDGTPFTADDVIHSYQRARTMPGSVASFAGFLRTIDSVTAPDPHTLVIKTNTPNPNLPLDLTSVYVVSRHATEGASAADFNSGKATIGTGPYRFVSYTPGERIELAANPNYRDNDAEAPTWAKVDYRYIPNAPARTAALLSGDVDVIDKVSVSDLERLNGSNDVNVFAYDGLRVLLLQPSFREGPNRYITDNAGKPLADNPLRDQRIREALSLAINREAITERIMQGAASVANQWMPKDTFGYNPDIPEIPFDPERAKQLLAEAGFPEGFRLTIHAPNDRYPLAPETAQAVAQFWTRIGVRTQVDVVPWAVYSGTANKNEYALSMIAWGNGTGEAAYALVNILTTVDSEAGRGASNWGHYSNAEVDRDLAEATSAFDEGEREAILRRSAVTVTNDVGVIPLFHYQNVWAARNGLEVKPMNSDRTAAQMVTRVEER